MLNTGDLQSKLKRVFAETIEYMLKSEIDEHFGFEKIALREIIPAIEEPTTTDNNRKNNISDYRKSKIAVPRDRDGAFKPKVFKKRQIRTDEIKQKAIGIFNIF